MILAFYSSVNSKGMHDATGAFIPEAQKFADLHGICDENLIGVKCAGIAWKNRAKPVLQALKILQPGSLHAVAFFGHGWPDGIQFGFDRDNVGLLARLLAEKSKSDLRIVLYACLAAENDVRDSEHDNVGPGTDGGFADVFRDELVRAGKEAGWVDAHKTKGHVDWNPFLVRMRMADVEDRLLGGIGGDWIVAPGSSHWKTWKRRLADIKDTMRLRFPLLTSLEIKTELDSGLPVTTLVPMEG